MKRLRFVTLLALTACQGVNSSVPSPILSSNETIGSRTMLLPPVACGYYDAEVGGNGGKVGLPPFGDDSFNGLVHYAPFSGGGTELAMKSCPDNENNAPVPTGYTPVWFCEIALNPNAVITFAPAKLEGTLYNTDSLSQKTDYYLYIYDSNNNLIESYQIGPYRKRRETLKFASPFENGFVLAGPYINLEIVHPTQ